MPGTGCAIYLGTPLAITYIFEHSLIKNIVRLFDNAKASNILQVKVLVKLSNIVNEQCH